MQSKVHTFLKDAEAPVTSGVAAGYPQMVLGATCTVSASPGAAVLLLQFSNDGVNWYTTSTLTFNLAAVTTQTISTAKRNDGWAFARAVLQSISGANAKISAYMGYADGS